MLGVPGARDRGCEGRNWEGKDEAVLVRTLEKRRGLSTNRATSPVMWRPTGASGLRGRSEGGPARGEKGGEEPGHDVWKATASRRWPAALLSGGGATLRRRQRNREAERWEMKGGPFCNFQKV